MIAFRLDRTLRYHLIYNLITIAYCSYLGTVPVISPIISDRHVRRGDTFNLTCGIQGQPGSEVAWLQDGKPLSTSAYMSIMSSEKQGVKYSTLKFIRTKMGDNGRIYSCAAWYPLTNVKAMSSAVITVTGKI